jgi:hypothetical protein
MGAIASGGVVVLNEDVVIGFGIGSDVIRRVAEREGRELARRQQAYREGRPMPDLAAKVVILVDDGQSYGFAAAFGAGESCEQQVLEQLVDLQRHACEYAKRDGLLAEDELFYAERNAVTVQNAEQYYREMFGGQVASWNLRDRHMMDTLEAPAGHLGRVRGEPAKIVVWAHNSRLGDARATEMGSRGELNVGQLVRERHRGDCRLIGFTTYTGTVTAADDWGAPADRKVVRPAPPDSMESCSTRQAARSPCCGSRWPRLRPRRCAQPGWSGPSASSTGPGPSGRATTSTPACPTSSTPSSTLTTPVRSSRSSGPPDGSAARYRRPIPLPSSPAVADRRAYEHR